MYLFQKPDAGCELSVEKIILMAPKQEIIVYSSQTLCCTAFQPTQRETQAGTVFHKEG